MVFTGENSDSNVVKEIKQNFEHEKKNAACIYDSNHTKFWVWKGAQILSVSINHDEFSINAEDYAEYGPAACHKVIKTIF